MNDSRLHRDLCAARRASHMLCDPVSSARLRAYIAELEDQLHRSKHGYALMPFTTV